MKVINKDGLVHNCHTEERYKSFLASGWEPYTPKEGKPDNKKDGKTSKEGKLESEK